MKTVSILTPTTNKRNKYLKILSKMIINQDYKHIIEWLIIDGTKEEESDLELTINEIKKQKKIPKIVFIKQDKSRNNKVGALRNILNDTAKGDILVNFDDDDLYSEKRVSHAVSKMTMSKLNLAACSAMYMYDNDFKYLYKFKQFGPFHGVGCTLAYTKEYTTTHKYGEEKGHAEEGEFTNSFENEAVQLDTKHTIIHLSHTTNTYTKKKDLVWEHLSLPDTHKSKMLTKISNTLKSFYKDKQLLKEYLKLIELNIDCKYDIVYHCGIHTPSWNPSNMTLLDDSLLTVIKLAEEWVKKGYKVGVYGNIETEQELNGVDYFGYSKFRVSTEYNRLILWGLSGLLLLNIVTIKTKKIILDLHDIIVTETETDKEKENLLINQIDKIDNIYVKSNYHKNRLIETYKSKEYQKMITKITQSIPNGINKQDCKNIENCDRYKYRFYTSYTSGLDNILRFFFPTIKKHIPKAELHIYQGNNKFKPEFKDYIKQFIQQPGVYDYETKPPINEKYKSNFYLYYTNFTEEFDSITIKECAYSGCIPILSTNNVFKELPGYQLLGNPDQEEDQIKGAENIVEILKEDNTVAELRKEIQKKESIYDWSDISQQWLSN